MDLTTRIGSVTLPNPVMTASGTAGHGTELAPYVDLAALMVEPYTAVNAPGVKIRTMAQTYDQVLPPGVQQTECCSFSDQPYDGTGATQCQSDQPCEVACDFRDIPSTLLAAAKVAPKVYGVVNSACQQVGPGATGPVWVGDPYCGGEYGTCVACQPAPPRPAASTQVRGLALDVALLFVAVAAVVAGGLLIAAGRRGAARR